MFAVALILLAILVDFLPGMLIGRLIPWGGEWIGTFTTVLLPALAFFAVFSIIDLVGMGIVTVWPTTFLFGFTSGWNRGCQSRSSRRLT
jgi:hypothetical protein